MFKHLTYSYPTWQADVFLAPQLHSAINRFKINMVLITYLLILIIINMIWFLCHIWFWQSAFPTLARLHEAYSECHEFQLALPEMQPDATSNWWKKEKFGILIFKTFTRLFYWSKSKFFLSKKKNFDHVKYC